MLAIKIQNIIFLQLMEIIILMKSDLLATNDSVFEFMMNSLRLNDGFDINSFEEKTFLPISEIKKELSVAKEKQLITEINGRIKPTILGQRYLNELLQIFLRG